MVLNLIKLTIPLVVISGLLTACKDNKASAKPKEKSSPVVDIMVVSPTQISNVVEANGTVIANEFVELRPEVSGRLIYLNVPEGHYVAQGTVIARINDADLKAQMAKTKVQLELTQKTLDRYSQLLAINGINQSDYDAVLNQVNGYKADLQYTQALIDKTVIKAPFSGTVGLRQVSQGAYVSPSTLIATIQQLNKIKIDFTLPEEYGAMLKTGNTVDILVDALKKDTRKAVVTAIEPQVNQQTRNMIVRAVLTEGAVNPGAFVKVYINAGVDKKALMVPTNCIIPDDMNKQIVVVKNGRSVYVPIKTGVRNADYVEITSGISAGDSVAVTGILFTRPNNPVAVRNIVKSTLETTE